MSDSICNNCEPQYGDKIKPTVNPELTPAKKGRQKRTGDSTSSSKKRRQKRTDDSTPCSESSDVETNVSSGSIPTDESLGIEDIMQDELIEQVGNATDKIDELEQRINDVENNLPFILPILSDTVAPNLEISLDDNTNEITDSENITIDDNTNEITNSENITIDDVLQLLEGLKSSEKQDIAADPYTYPWVLENLSSDADLNVRFNVAGNPNTSPSVLKNLSKDSEIIVRQVVAKNPNTPSDVLENLSEDKEPSVRESVTKNPILKPETRLYFIKNYIYNEFIRPYKPNFLSRSQQNIQSTSQSTLSEKVNILSEPPTSLSESDYIQPTSSEIENNSDILSNENLRIIAKDSTTPDEILEKLSNNEDFHVRYYVAYNPNTPKNVLEKLSNDEYWGVRRAVAENPKTPHEVLEKLSGDTKNQVSELAAKNLKNKSEGTPSSTSISSTANGTPSGTENILSPTKAPTLSEKESEPPTAKNKINSIFSKFISPVVTNKYFKELLKTLKILKPNQSDNEDSESSQKNKKKESKKKKIKLPKAIQNVWNSILNFFGEIIKAIIMYKVLEWISNPENTKKLIVMIRFFERLIKFLIDIVGFITPGLLNSLSFVIGIFSNLVKFTTDIVSFFMWLTTFLLISPANNLLKAIQLIPELFTKLVEFFTKTIPEALLGNSANAAEIPINVSNENDSDTSTDTKSNESSNRQIKNSVESGVNEKNTTNTNKSDYNSHKRSSGRPGVTLGSEVNKMAKGGIVTKPELSLVGEAGPEAVIPLSQFGSSSLEINNKKLSNTTSKIVPEFMKLLLLPFKVIGAGIISNIQGVVSEYPTLIPLVGNEISLIASTFGIPRTLVNVAAKDFGKTNLNNLNDLNTTDSILSLFGKSPIINEVTKSEDDTSQNKTEFKKQNDDSVRGLLGDILNALIYKNTSKSNLSTGNSPSNSSIDSPTSSHLSGDASSSVKYFGLQYTIPEKPDKTILYDDKVTPTFNNQEHHSITGTGTSIKYNNILMNDVQGRPIVLNTNAAKSFAKMFTDSGGYVQPNDITSSQRSDEHNSDIGGALNSRHLQGLSLDVKKNSQTARWMLEKGKEFGWYPLKQVYDGHIHFDYFPNSDTVVKPKNTSQVSLPNITPSSALIASSLSGNILDFNKSESNRLNRTINSNVTLNTPTITNRNNSSSGMFASSYNFNNDASPFITYQLSVT